MSENYNCPYCGSDPLWISGGYPTPSGNALLKQRKCGSIIEPLYPQIEERSELCREREASNRAHEANQILRDELTEKTNEASNWHQHYRDEASKAQKCKQAFIEQEKEVERLRSALEIIATPGRPDGTYNRDRRSCELIATEAINQLTK